MAIQYRSGTPYRNPFNYDGTGGFTSVTQTLTAKARIAPIPVTISARTWIAHQQGWPLLDPTDPGYSLWTDTRLIARANILNYIAFPTQTIKALAHITQNKTWNLQARARIVTAKYIQARACILPRFFVTQIPLSFSVQRTSQTSITLTFTTDTGYNVVRSISALANIQVAYSYRMTGHFIITNPVTFNPVVSIPNPIIAGRTLQTASARARIRL